MKLTTNRIAALAGPTDAKDKLVFGDDPKGLGVRVAAAAKAGSLENKSYVAQYTAGGAKRRMSLGPCATVPLADAVKAAKGLLGQAAIGGDPISERKRKAERDAFTLEALIGEWRELHLVGRRPSYAIIAPRALRRVFRRELSRPAADLDRATAVRALDQLVKSGAPVMAARAGNYLSACYAWAEQRGTIAVNPFMRLSRKATTRRERVLSDAEIAAVWRAAASPHGFHAIVRLLMLTGQRREEIAAMTWAELAPDLSTWTIPGERTKNHLAHIVPLSKQAQAIVMAQPRFNANSHVFAGRGSGPWRNFPKPKAELDRLSGVENWVLHDLRRTCATGLQKLGVRLEVTEAVLNHVGGSRGGIVGVYQRHDWADEKKAALQSWADRVEAIVAGRGEASNVVAFKAGA